MQILAIVITNGIIRYYYLVLTLMIYHLNK
jgi:hypothetical protein